MTQIPKVIFENISEHVTKPNPIIPKNSQIQANRTEPNLFQQFQKRFLNIFLKRWPNQTQKFQKLKIYFFSF